MSTAMWAAAAGIMLVAGITQGALAGDVGGMLRRIALDLPASVVGMVGLVAAFCLVTPVITRFYDVPLRQRLKSTLSNALVRRRSTASADLPSR